MSEETNRDLKLEIAHVLFIDIVGYSKLLHNEQSEVLRELNEIVRNTQQFRAADRAGTLLRLPTGDGVALIFRNSPEAPAHCALEIAEALQSRPRFHLRMGIHSGPVNEVSDVNERTNFAGAGINIAQRVMDCGDAGHILLSKHVAEDLEHHERWGPHLHELGEVTVKHGVSVQVVNLHNNGLGNPEVPAKIQRQHDAKAILVRRARRKRRTALVFGSLIALAAIGFVFFLLRDRIPRRPIEAQMDAKGIAVLPFENFSDDKENAFFADGIQDDILTSLAKIKDLRVISRTSVMGYRGAAVHSLREIGQVLGIANILEGSVRREGNRVVVTVQLIDALTDRHLWANRYDRTLADSLGLQGELASEIADALRVTLSPDEKARVETKPTENSEAYVFYLRANQISRNPDTLLADYKTAEQLYMQAVALDPDFALAHARLASVCAEVFHYYEPTDDWKTKARTEAQIALRLRPNLAEAHFALGQCIYWMDQDYEQALQQFDIAAGLSPSNGDIGRLIAAIKRRQGKWQVSLEEYERVAKLDPQNPNTVRELIFINTAMRRWPEAALWAERMRAMAPASIVAKIQSGYVDFWWKGDTQLLKSLLDNVSTGNDPDGAVTACRWEVAMVKRDFAEAKKVLQSSSLNEFSYTNAGGTPRSVFEGCILLAQGDRVNAQKEFELARPALEAAVKEAPGSADRHANLGWLYGFMGRKDDAIREGQRAVELKPESKDAVDGAIMNCYLAFIYARVGEKELAIPLIERLLKTPGAVDSVDYSITVNDLKQRWEWDSIRGDPRFQKLVSGQH
jgi:TolB-like protein/class 3 adenylate cyclase/cytochrome c-type biogenesis protein CcmH/NrfG